MKNFYHFTLAMLYMKIAGLFRGQLNNRWSYWMDRSVREIGKVKP